MTLNYGGKTILVVGASRGIGLNVALAFARSGADVWMTHRWNSLDARETQAILDQFPEDNPPSILEANADSPEDTQKVYALMKDRNVTPHAVVLSAALGKKIDTLRDLTRKGLDIALANTTWPTLDYTLACQDVLGVLPRYVLAVTADGSHAYIPKYAMLGMAKAALETLVMYMACMLESQGVHVNAINPGYVDTRSTRALWGEDFAEKARIAPPDGVAQGVANLTLALCSGLMDEMNGQTINATRTIGHYSAQALLHGNSSLYEYPGEPQHV